VQGEGAAAEIAHGLRQIVKVPHVDVVIVGRGGGSLEDLWAFNEEPVARAIAISPIPVISAVGHESDVTIADLVADVRAPTPSAAAELVVARKEEFSGRIDRLHERLVSCARARVQRLSRRVHELSGRRALAGYTTRLAMTQRRADELTRVLTDSLRAAFSIRARRLQVTERRLDAFDLGRRLARNRAALVGVDARLRQTIVARTHRGAARLGGLAGRLDSLSPLAVLARGYAVCWNDDRTRAIRDAADVAAGDTIHVTLSRGSIAAKVSDVE
jgi:exodeoxyribonuclease VII large subunit